MDALRREALDRLSRSVLDVEVDAARGLPHAVARLALLRQSVELIEMYDRLYGPERPRDDRAALLRHTVDNLRAVIGLPRPA